MEVLVLTCPHCGAIIEVGNDASAFDCPRCGSRIVLDTSENTDYAKNISDSNVVDDSTQPANKKKTPLRGVIISIVCGSVLACAGFSGYEWHCNREMDIARQQIREYIDSKDFANAKTSINAFEYHGILSNRKKSWQNQQDKFSIEVVKAEVRNHISNGNFIQASTELNSFMPSDSCTAEWTQLKSELQKEIDDQRKQQELRQYEEYKAKIQKFIAQGDCAHARTLIEEYLPPASVTQKWEKDKQLLLKEIEEKEREDYFKATPHNLQSKN